MTSATSNQTAGSDRGGVTAGIDRGSELFNPFRTPSTTIGCDCPGVATLVHSLTGIKLSPNVGVHCFVGGNRGALLTDVDVVLGDSGVRTNKSKGTSQLDEAFESEWVSRPGRSQACLLVCVGGGLLTDLLALLKHFTPARNLLVCWNGNEYGYNDARGEITDETLSSLVALMRKANRPTLVALPRDEVWNYGSVYARFVQTQIQRLIHTGIQQWCRLERGEELAQLSPFVRQHVAVCHKPRLSALLCDWLFGARPLSKDLCDTFESTLGPRWSDLVEEEEDSMPSEEPTRPQWTDDGATMEKGDEGVRIAGDGGTEAATERPCLQEMIEDEMMHSKKTHRPQLTDGGATTEKDDEGARVAGDGETEAATERPCLQEMIEDEMMHSKKTHRPQLTDGGATTEKDDEGARVAGDGETESATERPCLQEMIEDEVMHSEETTRPQLTDGGATMEKDDEGARVAGDGETVAATEGPCSHHGQQDQTRAVSECPYPSEVALDWDMRSYTKDQFVEFYGGCQGIVYWQAALEATIATERAVRYLRSARPQTLQSLWTILAAWVSDTPTVDDSRKLLMSAFYLPLRWRCDYTQQAGLPQEQWSSCDLSAPEHQESTWSRVKTYVQGSMLTDEQKASGRSYNTVGLIINKITKSANLCKLLLAYGVPDRDTLATMLEALAEQKQLPSNQRGRAAIAKVASEAVNASRNYRAL